MMKPFILLILLVGLITCKNQAVKNAGTDTLSTPAGMDPPSSLQSNSLQPQQFTLTVMIPEDSDRYRQAMTDYIQLGGDNPLRDLRFVKKKIVVPDTSDGLFKAAANAAVAATAPGTGKAGSVAYLKVKNGIAYILLNMDREGEAWAGSSVTGAILHPVLESTLLCYPEIKKVVFGYAPEDQ